MEVLEVVLIVAFSLCGLGVGIYGCVSRRRPIMKQSPSSENFANITVEDPQANDLGVS